MTTTACRLDILNDPPGKEKWKRIVNKQVNGYWTARLSHQSTLYSSLKYLHTADYCYGQRNPVIQTIGNAREIPRISTKLKLVTGTYILQSNRAAFNQNAIDPTCLLCKNGEETIKHFLLSCTALSCAREPIIDSITDTCPSCAQLILDSSACSKSYPKCDLHKLKTIEFQSRRLCHALHCERYKRLAAIPQRIRNIKLSSLMRFSRP